MSHGTVKRRPMKRHLEQFESALLERLTLLLGDFRAIKEGEAGDPSDLSRLSTHPADQGSAQAEADISFGRLQSESDEIQEINDAVERISDGSFGTCESCERPIAKERLNAIPWARFCRQCQERQEN